MNKLPSPLPVGDPAVADNEQPSPGPGEHDRERLRQQLEQRFRHSLRSGQLSPLLHLVMRYKLEGGT